MLLYWRTVPLIVAGAVSSYTSLSWILGPILKKESIISMEEKYALYKFLFFMIINFSYLFQQQISYLVFCGLKQLLNG